MELTIPAARRNNVANVSKTNIGIPSSTPNTVVARMPTSAASMPHPPAKALKSVCEGAEPKTWPFISVMERPRTMAQKMSCADQGAFVSDGRCAGETREREGESVLEERGRLKRRYS